MRNKMQVLATLCWGLSIVLCSGCADASEKLKIYNWTEYLSKSVIVAFQKETGIDVQYDVFDTAEMLEAKLMTGNSGYDIAFPTHSQIPRLLSAGAILALDKSKIPNLKNLDVKFLKKLSEIDPDNAYSVPYLWGSTLIGYNVEKVNAAFNGEPIPNSWSMVFNPKYAEKIQSCGIAFIDAPLEIFELALNYLGEDPHAQDQHNLEKARDLLLSVRPNIKYFHSARWMQDLANGDICVAVGYSGGVAMARDLALASGTNVKIEAMFPEEGALAWSDDMVIPKGAQNISAAYRFIDYIQRPEVIAEITNTIGYPNANASSNDLIDKNRTADESLFIPESRRDLLFFPSIPPLKTERVITRFWNSVKSGI